MHNNVVLATARQAILRPRTTIVGTTPVRLKMTSNLDPCISEINEVEFLLKIEFSMLNHESKLKIKNKGRHKPNLVSLEGPTTNKNRSFNPVWYDRKKWLTGSLAKKKLFCFPCILFNSEKGVWNCSGYGDLKNLSSALVKHEKTIKHIKSAEELGYLGFINMSATLDKSNLVQRTLHNEKVKKNQEVMTRLIDIVLNLAMQEHSNTGHDKSKQSLNKGNYISTLNLIAKYDPVLKSHLDYNKTFIETSHMIQNDLIASISSVINDRIIKEIKNAKFLAVQCDETTDISGISQLSLICHYVQGYKTYERFLGFFDVTSSINAGSLSTHLLTNLQSIINPSKLEDVLICQTYDGATAMSGKYSGVQSRIKEQCPMAMFIHCMAHRLNSQLTKGTNLTLVDRFFGDLSKFDNFFSNSSKRLSLLKEIQDTFPELKRKKIVSPSETYWNFKSRAVSTIFENYNVLQSFFTTIQSNEQGSWDSEALSSSSELQQYLEDFSFVFLLNIYNEIFSLTDILSNILQHKNMNIIHCLSHIESTVEQITMLQTDSNFEVAYEKSLEMCGESLDKQSKRQRIWVDFESGLSDDDTARANPKEDCRKFYLEVLDNVLSHMYIRFEDLQGLKYFSLLDCKQYDFFNNNFPDHLVDLLLKQYPTVFDNLRLKNELRCIWTSENFKSSSVSSLLYSLVELDLCTDIYKEVYTLCNLILTIPISTRSSERSFSGLKRIKSYLRCTMGQEKLDGLAKISIEKQLVQEMQTSQEFYLAIVEKFVKRNNQIIELEYK